MTDAWQDTELVQADLKRQERLVSERLPWEGAWREIDERFPDGAGGFNTATPGAFRGGRNFDVTHITAAEKFAAAGVAITTPESQQYIRPRFGNPDLNKLRSVQLWNSRGGQRLFDIRHAMHAGFTVAANEDWGQLGRYGTSLIWQEAIAGRGMIYKTLHLSECWIDTDLVGLVDTVHRKFTRSVDDLAKHFGEESLSPKMRKALEEKKGETKFEILHIVMPNTAWDEDKLDYRRFPIASRFLAIEEKFYIRRAGFHTSPISCSRHLTSPGEKYGRSPAMMMNPTINGLNAMRHTTLRALHKAVDPALLFNNDDGVTRLSTKAGGLNPGLVDDSGRALVQRMPGGEVGLPITLQDTEQEREVVRVAFLSEFYKILTDPNNRMTTTEVLEVMSKQGVLVRPYAGRYAMEKQHPMTNRDLDLAVRAGQIDPFPPEVLEEGAWPIIEYENPLAAMARAESTSKTMRWMEVMQTVAGIDEEAVDVIDTEAIARGSAEEIGVKPEYVRDVKGVEARRTLRAQQKQAEFDAQQLATGAGATLDLAKASQISEAA